MGYTTDFSGGFTINRPLTVKEANYINEFSDSRRIKRNVNKLMKLYKGEHGIPNPPEKSADAIYGIDGEYFTFNDGNHGQNDDASVINHNRPPITQPGLWCQWVVVDNGETLEWDGGEKFYNYVEWLQYLIDNFFKRWGVKLNGEVEWFGEDSNDRGKIVVKNNVVKIYDGVVTFRKR